MFFRIDSHVGYSWGKYDTFETKPRTQKVPTKKVSVLGFSIAVSLMTVVCYF